MYHINYKKLNSFFSEEGFVSLKSAFSRINELFLTDREIKEVTVWQNCKDGGSIFAFRVDESNYKNNLDSFFFKSNEEKLLDPNLSTKEKFFQIYGEGNPYKDDPLMMQKLEMEAKYED